MRNIVHRAAIGVNDVLGRVMSNIIAGDVSSEDEQLQRYVTLHRYNPLATQAFVTQYAPPGVNPVAAQNEYERAMESMLKQRGYAK